MSKFNEERIYKLRNDLSTELQQLLLHSYLNIFSDIEGKYLHVIYDGKSVCKITVNGSGYNVTFTSEFNGKNDLVRWLPGCKTISRAIQNAISDYEKGQNTMVTLSNLRDYILQELGNLVTAAYEVRTDGIHQDRVKINYKGHWVCSIYRDYDNADLFDVVFYKPFIYKEAGFQPFANSLTIAEIPRTIKNRIDIYNGMNDNRIAVDISNDTVEKTIYMMIARGSGKTQYTLELMKDLAKRANNGIKDVIFNDPATIVFWVDGSKTVVKCQKGETFDPEKGLAMAISKKVLGNDYGYYETFAKYVGRYNKKNRKKYIDAIDNVLREIAPDEIVRDGVVYKRVEDK